MGWSPPGSLADVSLLAARPDLSEVVELRGEWQQAAGGVAFPAWGAFLVCRSCTSFWGRHMPNCRIPNDCVRP